MTKTLIKPRLLSNKLKQKPKPHSEMYQYHLPANLQSLNENHYQEMALLNIDSFYV